jgi:hypothetical protein
VGTTRDLRHARGLLLAVLCSIVGVLALSGAPAYAATPVALSSFPGSDELIAPQAVAVDRVTGDVYVLNLRPEGVDRFDSAGRPLAFSASGSYVSGNELLGTPSESFKFFQPSAAQVAVDNSGGPFNGDIYVTDTEHGVVDVFASDGTYRGRLNGSGTPQSFFKEPCGVAVDPAGRVYVGDAGGFVERYTPSSSGLPVSDADYVVSEVSVVGEACAVAVNASGDVFASTWPVGPLNEYDHTQFPATGSAVGTPTLVDEKSQAVAVDSATGRIYVDEGTQIAIYEISGGKPSPVESFGSLSGRSYGVAVGSGETVYVSDEGAEGESSPPAVVEVFGPPKPSAPAVVSESTANVSADGAELRAQVNPDFADTTYRFQYGATSAYGSEVPVPAADIGSGGGLAGVQNVAVHLQKLLPGSTYHYRVLAENTSPGKAEGSDATFTTQPAGGRLVLPDGRAWEMVSPLDKNNSIIVGIDGLPGDTGGGLLQAEEAGNSIVYASSGAFARPAGAPQAAQYLAARATDGWSTVNIEPPIRAGTYGVLGAGGSYQAFSSDLSKGLFLNGSVYLPVTNPPPSEKTGEEVGRLAGYQNYYLRDNRTGGFQAVLTEADASMPSEPASGFQIEFQGASPDLSHVVFSTSAALTSHAVNTGGPNLYEWAAGQLQVVNVLPEEKDSTPGAVLGGSNAGYPRGVNPVSNNGSKVFFTDNQNLYARVNGSSTVQVDASQGGLEKGGGLFQIASRDGSRVFFTDSRRLTKDSTVNTYFATSDLYEYDFGNGHLSDLTTQDPVSADVQGVLGASSDGSYVYFVANGVLAPGASRGVCAPAGDRQKALQRCNLYVWHRGASSPSFIATLSGADNSERAKTQLEQIEAADDWAPSTIDRTARVTPDGLHLAFMSNQSLTGYDNRNIESGQPEQEVYVYSASSGALSCASCRHTGSRPTGSSSIPGGTQFEIPNGVYQSRALSETEGGGARVFFDSMDAIVPQDVNGKRDVYEWEENGVGNCQQPGGCVSLISSGTSSSESSFADASASGKDVFFLTYSQLVPQDTDNLVDVYDAREGGGFPSTLVASSSCNGEDCKPAPLQAPVVGTPATTTSLGVGNLSALSSKPVAKHKHKHRSKKHRRKTHKAKKARRHRARRARPSTRRRG